MNRFIVVMWLLVLSTPLCAYSQDNAAEWVLSPKDTDKVEIDMRAVFKNRILRTGDKYYVSPHGDTFYVDVFRFYITNISFIGERTATLANDHLFDVADTNTYSFIVKNVPPGVYHSIRFTAGVDSIANVSGANSGDLDPIKGMYWAWNSGYIMAKLEGRSNVCKTVHNAFEFHIGGYMPPHNAARTVTLKIPEYFQVGRQSMPGISMTADVAAWFANNLDLAKTNSIMIPGKEACMMADNYSRMFFIDEVSYTPLNR
ncbi:MAG: hypothetical protein K0Q79_1679 [Flavipsychrobacter sp.]|jgi:hypothetical protein|nr:hypothetical protein [Flavipsychrobacter sp.]